MSDEQTISSNGQNIEKPSHHTPVPILSRKLNVSSYS